MKGIQTTRPRKEVAVKGSKVARRFKQEEEKKKSCVLTVVLKRFHSSITGKHALQFQNGCHYLPSSTFTLTHQPCSPSTTEAPERVESLKTFKNSQLILSKERDVKFHSQISQVFCLQKLNLIIFLFSG